jgi:uncharacterized zinc-type alcohol dehydrogenase-like protein
MSEIPTIGFAAQSPTSPLAPHKFNRRALRADDVAIEITYSGVCHSDLHTVRNEWSSWGPTTYPALPGHEIVGKVIGVGADAKKYKVGDAVAIGCMVDSCLSCDRCKTVGEQFCNNGGAVFTYNGKDKVSGDNTMGGYSKHIVCKEHFVLRVPDGLDLAKAAPLLCAGITTYSPLITWKVGPGSRVAVAGLGGLGHMGVKFAKALGAHVTVLSRSVSKTADAKRLGADAVLITTDADAMKKAGDSFDFILDTIPVEHPLDPLVPLLDVDGTLCLVGQLGNIPALSSTGLLFGRRRVTGSPIGNIKETQEMLDFCAAKNVLPDVEMIRMDEINEAYERMLRSDVRYRFVIDMASLSL